jgi:UDP-perosamine 4-acetyltransferase
MIKPEVVVIGSGGHAKVVIELIRAQGIYRIAGCTDADSAAKEVLGVPLLGSDECLPELLARGISHAFIALGSNSLRLNLGRKVEGMGFTLINAISPQATVSPSARLGVGVAIMAGAVINAEAVIDDLAIINTRSSVDHDCRIGAAAHIAPGSVVAGGVIVGQQAFLGAGAIAIPGVMIGEGAIVGAGGVVIRKIRANTVAVGVPARPLARDVEME